MNDRIGPSPILRCNPVIAVLRARHAEECRPIIHALVKGGIRSIELTLSTGGVFDGLPSFSKEYGDEVEIGVGTVTSMVEAERSLEAGARFLVTPITDPDLIAVGVRENVPVFPGGLTPTELFQGWKAGACAVKVFPASVVGPGYVSQLRGPFPGIEIIPSGGVAIGEAAAWIRAGAMAVSLGGPLLGDAFDGGSLQGLTERARRVSSFVSEALEGRKE